MVLIGPLLRTGHVWLFFFSFSSQRLHSEPQSCLRKFQSGDKIVIDSFKGVEFAQWLIRKNESRNLDDALVSCQQLLDAGLIKPRKSWLFNPYDADGLWESSIGTYHWPLTIDHGPWTMDHWPLTIDHGPWTIDLPILLLEFFCLYSLIIACSGLWCNDSFFKGKNLVFGKRGSGIELKFLDVMKMNCLVFCGKLWWFFSGDSGGVPEVPAVGQLLHFLLRFQLPATPARFIPPPHRPQGSLPAKYQISSQNGVGLWDIPGIRHTW